MRAKFIRGQDPKAAMNIGSLKDGYRVDKEPDFEDWEQGANKLLNWRSWNWNKNIGSMDHLHHKTKVTPELENQLDPLPVVTFRNYYDSGPCLFGDWPQDFPFHSIPFIANVEEEEDRSFLISPEGYDFPRYITELV